MNDSLTRGDVVVCTYTKNGTRFQSNGIVLETSRDSMVLGHNFKGTAPIDTLTVSTAEIDTFKIVTPKEINISDDLGIA